LPSGIQILKDENCKTDRISVGIELNPAAKIAQNRINLFEKSGYNYFYLKEINSAGSLSDFVSLLSKEKIFLVKKEEGPTNLLRLVLNDFNVNSSPIVNITFGITGKIDETEIIELAKMIPDSIISNSTAYYKLERVIGKQLYRGNKNFIANISPPSFSDDFCAFLVFIKLINNRNLKVRFSPETAPSPFLIYLSEDKISLLAEQPEKNEIEKAITNVSNWLTVLFLQENRSRFLILTASMGVEEKVVKKWPRRIKNLKESDILYIWKKYLTSGFVASLDTTLILKVQEIFPESDIIE